MHPDTDVLVQRALWAGQHALPLFFVLLGMLLAATWVCWWGLRQSRVNLSPTPVPGLRIAAGLAVMLLGAGLFVALAGQLDAAEKLGRADQALTGALRASVPKLASQIFAALTHLGDTATLTGLCIGVAIVLLALGRRWLALGWVVAVAGNGLLNDTLKEVFGRARPLRPDSLLLEPGFSFPSGHSSGSVVAYGMLAYLALRLMPRRWHLPALLVAMALAFTIGASRLFLRVHFASDVIAGFASGSAWLAVCLTGIALMRWWQQRTA